MNTTNKKIFTKGQILINKYEVISRLGEGHFGNVYRVFNRNLGHEAALKVVDTTNPIAYRSHIEAQAQNICSHDNVVKIITSDILLDSVLIEMEYIANGSLEDKLKREFTPVIDSVGYIKNILYALEHAHNRGIIHRDVKPANILLAETRAKLSDFGTIIQPSTGISAADVFYQPHAAPEAANFAIFDPRGDVFGAGMTLLRAVNNIPDIGSYLSNHDLHKHIQNGTLPNLIGYEEYIPRRLKSAIKKALNPSPADRFPDAKAFRQALERLSPLRRWIKLPDQNWQCTTSDGRIETIVFTGGKNNKVDHKIGSRKILKDCREFKNEHEARLHMSKLVAETTFY